MSSVPVPSRCSSPALGEDGALGMQKLELSGAFTLAQDEVSSVVSGIPKAAVERGAIDEISSLDEIPRAILRDC